MGVGGLRSILEEIAEERSLHELAWDYWLKEAYGDRLMRVGIDVSIWLISTSSIDQRFEAAEASRILLYKLFQIYSAPVQPLFVFDGKDRPSVKRGKDIDRDKQIVNEDMFKDMLDSFGFETWDAPGEAEAELAYLCSIGQLDAVITEDIDALLFRAPIVLAKQPRKGEKELATDSYMVFRMDKIYNKFKLDSSGLIFVALLSGGDYDQIGVKGLGHRNAFLLAQARPCQNIPFGELLVTAYKRRPIDQFTDSFLPFFRAELASTLRENKDKTFARRQRKAAEAIPSDFPNIQTLNRYVRPLTSASEGVIGWPGFQTDGREGLGLGEIAGLTKRITGWKDDLLLEKFRRCLWKGAATRVLPAELAYPGGWNMACDRLEVALLVRTSQPRVDERPQSRMTDHFSVRKRPVHEKTTLTGGPSKLAPASAAAAVSLLSSPPGGPTEIPSSDPLLPPPPSLTFKSEYPFIKSITLSRRQPSRSNALEYRCVIDPSRFVKETMAGLGRFTGSLLERKRTKKRSDGIDAESLTDEDEEPGGSSGEEEDDDQRPSSVHQPRRSRPLSDPYQPFLVWLPNHILSLTHRSLVQSFEAAQDLKIERSGMKEKNKARKVERWTKEKLGEKDQRAFMDAFLARGQTGNEVEENTVGGVKSREKRKGKEREAIEPTLIDDSSIDIGSDPSEISFIRQSSVPLYSSQSQIQSKAILESPSSQHTSRREWHKIPNRNRNGFHRSISNPTIHLSQTPTRPARPLALQRSSRSHLEADNHQAHPQVHASDVTKDRETIHLISSPLFPPPPAPKQDYIRAGSWSPCSKIESTSRPMATIATTTKTTTTITYTTPNLYPYENEIVDIGSSSDLNSESETIRGTNESERRSAKSPRLEQSGLVHDPISIDDQPSDPDLEDREKRGEPEEEDDFDSVWFELTSSDLRALP